MIGVSLVACLDDRVGRARGVEEFVAFQSDFAGYDQWPGALVAEDPLGEGHLSGPRWVYVDALPGPADTTFPVGTIVVKEARNGAPEDWDIFAMVKRGAGFNARGAQGWEWFELSRVDDLVVVDWRGEVPPALSGYDCVSTDPTQPIMDCNGCHGSAWANDYVQDDFLRLGAL